MPHISYAGVPLLLEDPGYEFQVWLERTLSLQDLTLFGIEPPDIYQGRNRPRGPFVGQTFQVSGSAETIELPSVPFVGLPLPNYSTRRPPRWKINTLWWPTGATRWAIGLFLADEASVLRIQARLSGGLATFLARDFPGSSPGVFLQTRLYLLPPRELNNTESGINGYLLCLVDERFYWQFTDTGLLEVNTSTLWTEVYDHIATAMGIVIAYDDINPGYFRPDPLEMTRRYENGAMLLDATAHSVGQRIVYGVDNLARAQNPSSAATQNTINQRRLLQLGLSAGGAQAKYRRSLYPQYVRVIFPAEVDGEFLPDGNVYPYTVAKTLVTSDSHGFISGTIKLIHTTAPAQFANTVPEADIGNGTATPLNINAVRQLAEQIARDYYAWLAQQYDEAGVGLIPWVPTGFDDYAWWHFGYQTRIPYAFGGNDAEATQVR